MLRPCHPHWCTKPALSNLIADNFRIHFKIYLCGRYALHVVPVLAVLHGLIVSQKAFICPCSQHYFDRQRTERGGWVCSYSSNFSELVSSRRFPTIADCVVFWRFLCAMSLPENRFCGYHCVSCEITTTTIALSTTVITLTCRILHC